MKRSLQSLPLFFAAKNDKATDKKAGMGSSNSRSASNNGMVIGIVLGACAVLFIVFLAFLSLKLYQQRNEKEKFSTPPMDGHRVVPTPIQQVTLLPISHHEAQYHPDHTYHRTNTLLCPMEHRPPPYNESFMDHSGPVIAV